MKLTVQVDLSEILGDMYNDADGDTDYINSQLKEDVQLELKKQLVAKCIAEINSDNIVNQVKKELWEKARSAGIDYKEHLEKDYLYKRLVEDLARLVYGEWKISIQDSLKKMILSDTGFMRDIIKELKD